MITEAVQDTLARTREHEHARCVVCGQVAEAAPRIRFAAGGDDSVEATFVPLPAYEGYPGMLHGGIIATVLDAAMTHCLFARGTPAVTGELTVRYREPVAIGKACLVHGWLERASPPLFYLRAELRQDGRVRARASAKFMLRPRT